jgi:3',5'-cyclic AMP phosphodiesterase CpdA
VGPVAVIGVNSGVPSKTAIGQVGPDQMARLAQELDRLGKADVVRLVMIHHPPVPGLATPGRSLVDRAALAKVLAQHGAELVVHGHNHTLTSVVRGGIRVEGVGSASAARAQGHQPLACYNLIRIRGRGALAEIEIETRGLSMPDGHVKRIAVRTLPLQTGAEILKTGL